MSKLFIKSLAIALLAIFMVNTAAWSFSSNRVAHEIEHSRDTAPMMVLLDQHDDHQHAALNVDHDDDKAPGASEHQLLHAVDHLQFFPNTVFYAPPVSLPSTIAPHFIPRALPLAAFDPPFRPPRSTSLL